MKCKVTISLVLVFILSACVSSPKNIVVSPQLFGYTKDVYVDKSINFKVIDQRPSSQVVQILKDDEPAKLFSSQDTLTNICTKVLIPTFNKQGLQVSEVSPTQVTLFINTALISVNQNFVDYHVNTNIALTASVLNNGISTSKTFSSKGKSHGPLHVDMAVLERDFNHQLAKLLINVVNSPDLQHKINLTAKTPVTAL